MSCDSLTVLGARCDVVAMYKTNAATIMLVLSTQQILLSLVGQPSVRWRLRSLVPTESLTGGRVGWKHGGRGCCSLPLCQHHGTLIGFCFVKPSGWLTFAHSSLDQADGLQLCT